MSILHISEKINEEISSGYNITPEQEYRLPYQVNLAWDVTKNIEIQLGGCGL